MTQPTAIPSLAFRGCDPFGPSGRINSTGPSDASTEARKFLTNGRAQTPGSGAGSLAAADRPVKRGRRAHRQCAYAGDTGRVHRGATALPTSKSRSLINLNQTGRPEFGRGWRAKSRLPPRSLRVALAVTITLLCSVAGAQDGSKQLHDLFAREWDWTMEQNPTWASDRKSVG